MNWRDAVWEAVKREADPVNWRVTRQGLLEHQLDWMRGETGTAGKTPEQTISRTLQELIRQGVLIFVSRGVYELSPESREETSTDEALKTEKLAEILARVGQSPFRKKLMERFGGACPLTGISDPELLRASHIIPWARCMPTSERRNPDNGLLLSALWDAAFDRGIVSFADDGRALVAAKAQQPLVAQLKAAPRTVLPETALTPPVVQRLAWHRREYRLSRHTELISH